MSGVLSMYSKEIVKAICANHVYEYCIVSKDFEVLKYSEKASKYCDKVILMSDQINLFDLVPELVGMEDELSLIMVGDKEELIVPMVFKEPNYYVNITVHSNRTMDPLIVLFENVTDNTIAQYNLRQANNNNLLLLDEIAEKNKQLEMFNKEMQKLVDEEVAKNIETQHMMELQTRHAQMGEMIAMITHQWKQPLSVIQTLGTLLKIKFESGKLTQNIFKKKMNNLLQQTRHLSQTVNDFQQFFTPSKKKVDFDMNETITSVLNLVEMEYALDNVHLSLVEVTPVSVYGYANEYNQVILSLLNNAKDALVDSGQAHKHIEIKIDMHDKRSLVSISDNAGGIPLEMIDNVFTQYVTSKKNGSGLGLYIAKTVIENNMQGKIWVKNTEEGACFSILL